MGYREWASGDQPTEAEFDAIQRQGINPFPSTTNRDTEIVSGSRHDGMMTVVTDDGEFWVWNPDIAPSGEWVRYGRYKAWGTYTPALTATTTNPTLGTGSAQLGKWSKEGTHATVAVFLKFGSSGAAPGSGTYEISLPSECPVKTNWYGAQEFIVGNGIAIDDDTSIRYQLSVKVVGPSTIRLESDGLTGPVTEANLVAWNNNDLVLSGTFEYETEK